jgi:glycine cleavage system H lipoate-binding protein
VDVVVITGYATIESAVETMQHGAVDYVQKPFTVEEMIEFTRKLLIKRQARHEAQRRPAVRIVVPAMAETTAAREYCVPGGAFLADGHTWSRLEPGGQVRIGLDDFARKALGPIDEVGLPRPGATVRRGEVLFAVRRSGRAAHFTAPIGGRVIGINEALAGDPSPLSRSPYDRGWVCILEPSDLAGELAALRIGQPVVAWYQEEIARLQEAGGPAEGGAPAIDWTSFEERFLRPVAGARA